MDAFVHDGFWILLGITLGVGGAYVPLARSISKLRQDSIMKDDCEKLSALRAKPTAQAIATMATEVTEVKADVKEMRKDFEKILRYINGKGSQ